MMIDTHSHIYAEQFDADRDQVIKRAISSGVTRFIMPAIDSLQHDKMFDIANRYDNHYPTIGLHPTSVKENYREELDIVEEYLSREKARIVAIGEVGLDYYWDRSFAKEQAAVLRKQMDWALEQKLPIIVHTRDAFSDMLQILRDYKGSSLRVLFHSYSGTLSEAEEILSMGNHLLGVGGVVTFKKSELPSIIQVVGVQNIVLETDAPYLAPVPYRGKRNESSYISIIGEYIASFMGIDKSEVANITTASAIDFFNLK